VLLELQIKVLLAVVALEHLLMLVVVVVQPKLEMLTDSVKVAMELPQQSQARL
jgi:hypothetical protein